MNLKFFFVFAILILGINALDKQRDCKCRKNVHKRIENGRIISANSYPWLAAIQIYVKYDKAYLQDGMAIVLNEDTILTGGIVVYPFTNDEFLEDPNYTNSDEFKEYMRGFVKVVFKDGQRIQKSAIDKVIFHPNYRLKENDYNANLTIENDIALIKLKTKLQFGKQLNIQPACLDATEQDHYEGALNVAGYGIFDTKSQNMKSADFEYSKELREGEVFDVTKTDEQCKGKEKKLMCVDGSKSATYYSLCTGDEGTAIHQTKNGKSSVIAVASITTGLGRDQECNIATMSSRISHYIDFIEEHIGTEYCT